MRNGEENIIFVSGNKTYFSTFLLQIASSYELMINIFFSGFPSKGSSTKADWYHLATADQGEI